MKNRPKGQKFLTRRIFLTGCCGFVIPLTNNYFTCVSQIFFKKTLASFFQALYKLCPRHIEDPPVQLGAHKIRQEKQTLTWMLNTAGELETDFAVQEIVSINGPIRPPWYEWLVRPRDIGTNELVSAVQSLEWMMEFDAAVIRSACHWVEGQNSIGQECKLSVNVFADSISDPSFTRQVVAIINSADLNPEQLCFEIVEHTPVQDIQAATKFCRTLRAMGSQIALDDIGSGHVHVSLLAPETLIDFLKIDRSAVLAAKNSERQFKAVQSVIDFAESVKVPVVLEGIESKEDLNLIERFGAEFYQGYLQGKPQLVDWGVNEDRKHVAFALRELTA
ncbi:MAG: EAL domain-containing protein [Lysobacterales bacterium]